MVGKAAALSWHSQRRLVNAGGNPVLVPFCWQMLGVQPGTACRDPHVRRKILQAAAPTQPGKKQHITTRYGHSCLLRIIVYTS